MSFNEYSGRQRKIEEVSSVLSYIGTAPRGAATSDAVWTLFELTEAGTPTVTSRKEAVGLFTWDNRASVTYK